MLVPGEQISMEFSSKYNNVIQENAFENVVYEMVAIFFLSLSGLKAQSILSSKLWKQLTKVTVIIEHWS